MFGFSMGFIQETVSGYFAWETLSTKSWLVRVPSAAGAVVTAPASGPVFQTEPGNPLELFDVVGYQPDSEAEGMGCDQQVH